MLDPPVPVIHCDRNENQWTRAYFEGMLGKKYSRSAKIHFLMGITHYLQLNFSKKCSKNKSHVICDYVILITWLNVLTTFWRSLIIWYIFILVVILERLQGYIIEIAYCTLAIYTIRITDHALYEASLIDPIEMIDTNFIDKNLLIR